MKASINRKILRRTSVLLLLFLFPLRSQAQTELINHPGFEEVVNGQAMGWEKYGNRGYAVDKDVHHSGNNSVRMSSSDESGVAGASFALVLNQTRPLPVLISGWSKAENVSVESIELFTSANYAIYVDIVFMDGTPLWGQFEAFSSGTHDWEKRQILIALKKPIARISMYALFRYRTGTVWFDDFSAIQFLHFFDSQEIAPPALPASFISGWFARDVAVNSSILPLNPGKENTTLHLLLKNLQPLSEGKIETATLQDTSGKDRAITLYYLESFQDDDLVWWADIRNSVKILDGEYELKNLARVHGGAIDHISIYPIACITGVSHGRAVGAAVQEPRVVRTGYHTGTNLFYVAFDFGLTASNVNNDGKGHGEASASVVHYDADPTWGFRDAIKTFYTLFPNAFARHGAPDGIWIPFTDPATISNVQDFGFAYHETGGDALTRAQVSSDDSLGILTFRYSEPCDYGINLVYGMPKSAEYAQSVLEDAAARGDNGARAVIYSGARDENGKLYAQYQDFPWLHGVKWALNNNPRFSTSIERPSAASLTYSDDLSNNQYGPDNRFKPGMMDGEYIDSLENWDLLDYGTQAIALSSTPPTFSSLDFQPVVPLWMSQYELVAWMSSDLHGRGKLIMANTTPVHLYSYPFLLDAMGIELDWNQEGQWSPDDDSVMNLRRTLSGQKPYLLLQNTDFSQFGTTQVQKYFERSLFYGMLPSFFSADASSNPYWENPGLYNRDRPMFQHYIPVIKSLSAAGWQPVPYAKTDHASVYIERFGVDRLTLLNDSTGPLESRVTVVLSDLWSLSQLRKYQTVKVNNLITGEVLVSMPISASITFSVTLDSQQALALQLVASDERARSEREYYVRPILKKRSRG